MFGTQVKLPLGQGKNGKLVIRTTLKILPWGDFWDR